MLRMPNIDLTPLADAIKYAADCWVYAALVFGAAYLFRGQAR